MTFPELVERAKRRLNAGQPQPRVWPESEVDIAAAVTQAMDMLARQVMRDDSRRAWLQQVYSLALDSEGKGALSSATANVSGEIILDGIRFGVVIDADGNILQPLTHYADFLRPQQTVYGYYCLKDQSILTRVVGQQASGPNEIVGASSPLSITANYVPVDVSDWPAELEADLVDALVDIVALKVVTSNANTE